ncbi:hypothetical protein [Aeromonas salmonicida]|uniref:hypothetical protein n=1 Tax=Aeromonas salmonicida TaxID=645 RepID=UPI0015F28F8B|nr:hypothetical protein [Aeromonas salmonicida]
MKEFIVGIRNIRAEMNVAPSVALNVLLKCDAKDTQRAGDNEPSSSPWPSGIHPRTGGR